MHYSMWRGVAGLVKPTRRPGSLETLIRLLPEGIGVVPLLLNVRAGSHAEFSSAIPHYEKYVAELAEQGMDMIHPGGTPPFMLQGYKGEDEADQVLGEEVQDADLHLRAEPRARHARARHQEIHRRELFGAAEQDRHRLHDAGRLQGRVDGADRRAVQRGAAHLAGAALRPHQDGCSARTRAPTASTSRAAPGTPRASSSCSSRTCRCRWCTPTSRRPGKS